MVEVNISGKIYRHIVVCSKDAYLLDMIDIVKSTILELSTTSRKSKILSGDFDPVLMPFDLSQLGAGNVIEPYLKRYNRQSQKISLKAPIGF